MQNFLKIWLLSGDALTSYRSKFAKNSVFALGDALEAIAPPGYAYGLGGGMQSLDFLWILRNVTQILFTSIHPFISDTVLQKTQ